MRGYTRKQRDTDTWAWMLKGWKKYSKKDKLFYYYRRKERTRTRRGDKVESEGMEAPEEVSDVELVVEGKKEFHMRRMVTGKRGKRQKRRRKQRRRTWKRRRRRIQRRRGRKLNIIEKTEYP